MMPAMYITMNHPLMNFQNRCSLLIAFLVAPCALHSADVVTVADTRPSDDIAFIENGRIRVGVKKSSGCGIAWFSVGIPSQLHVFYEPQPISCLP